MYLLALKAQSYLLNCKFSFIALFLFSTVLLIGCLPSHWSLHLFLICSSRATLFVPTRYLIIGETNSQKCWNLTCDELKHEWVQLCCVTSVCRAEECTNAKCPNASSCQAKLSLSSPAWNSYCGPPLLRRKVEQRALYVLIWIG